MRTLFHRRAQRAEDLAANGSALCADDAREVALLADKTTLIDRAIHLTSASSPLGAILLRLRALNRAHGAHDLRENQLHREVYEAGGWLAASYDAERSATKTARTAATVTSQSGTTGLSIADEQAAHKGGE